MYALLGMPINASLFQELEVSGKDLLIDKKRLHAIGYLSRKFLFVLALPLREELLILDTMGGQRLLLLLSKRINRSAIFCAYNSTY